MEQAEAGAAGGANTAVSPDEERWAEALAVQLEYGDQAPVFVAERIGVLALQGDAAGIARWKDIATRLDALSRSARH